MNLLCKTKFLLQKHGIFPRKNLGQCFIVESTLFKKMVDYASLNSKDTVLDIGAGLGFLTSFLAERCKQVLAVETDKKLTTVFKTLDESNIKKKNAIVSEVEKPDDDIDKDLLNQFLLREDYKKYQRMFTLLQEFLYKKGWIE